MRGESRLLWLRHHRERESARLRRAARRAFITTRLSAGGGEFRCRGLKFLQVVEQTLLFSKELEEMGIELIRYKEFKLTRDSKTSTAPGEGMGVFNPQHAVNTSKYLEGRDRNQVGCTDWQ
jgi:hypothetical protein